MKWPFFTLAAIVILVLGFCITNLIKEDLQVAPWTDKGAMEGRLMTHIKNVTRMLHPSPGALHEYLQQAINYLIGNDENVLDMIPAAVLGYMGKHGLILLIARDSVPKAVRGYLKMVKPFATSGPGVAVFAGVSMGLALAALTGAFIGLGKKVKK